jgi:DNA-binding winged helix-turn-helix (wHTH) protein
MTVAYKDPLNLQLPQQDQRPLIERNQNLGAGLFPRTAREVGNSPVLDDHRQYFQVLREMLESDAYQVALVPRGRWDCIPGSRAEQFSTAASTVLIPFRWTELVAQVHEFVRESNALPECRIARFEDVCVDFTRMEVSRSSGEPITLTIQEFKTLKCFLLNPDRIFSRSELLDEAWGYKNYPSTRTVDNHVLRLRQKLERDPARPVHFLTVHRVGYKFVPWPGFDARTGHSVGIRTLGASSIGNDSNATGGNEKTCEPRFSTTRGDRNAKR